MTTTPRYTNAQLQALWVQAGGNKVYAPMAAAVALAESGGNPNSTNVNHNGTTDRGLWQINSIHGSQSTYDPLANAKAAVAISHNGTNWRPWCSAWSNNACGGTFMGAGAHVLRYLPADSAGAPPPPAPPPGNTGAQTTGALGQTLSNRSNGPTIGTTPVGVDINSGFWDWILNKLGITTLLAWLGYALLMILGLAMMVIGIILLIGSTRSVKAAGRSLLREFAGSTVSTRAAIREERRQGLLPPRDKGPAEDKESAGEPPAKPPPKKRTPRVVDTGQHTARGKGRPSTKSIKDFKGTGGAHRSEP